MALEEGRPSRAPFVLGVAAIVAGLVLLRVAGWDGPVRPRVLGEVISGTSTTTSPVAAVPTTRAGTTRAATTRTTVRRATTTTRSDTTTSADATGAAPGTPTTSSSGTSTTSSRPTTTTQPCPTGAPVAEMRSWDGSAVEDGWHLRVSGVVSNRTGATVDVGAVRITFTRDDGTTWDVPDADWPVPDPWRIAPQGEGGWSWEGTAPADGGPFSGVVVALTSWSWADAPAGCASAGAAP